MTAFSQQVTNTARPVPTNVLIRWGVIYLWSAALIPACERASAPSQHRPAEESPVPSAERIQFPDELHTHHQPVDDFIHRALTACVDGDYESFRLMWNAQQDPLRREEFEQGWQAVQSIRVLALEKVVLESAVTDAGSGGTEDQGEAERTGHRATPGVSHVGLDTSLAPDVSFALLTEAVFDPNHPIGKRQQRRDFVLIVMRERGNWRLGRAPERVRDWLKERAAMQREYEQAPETRARNLSARDR